MALRDFGPPPNGTTDTGSHHCSDGIARRECCIDAVYLQTRTERWGSSGFDYAIFDIIRTLNLGRYYLTGR